MTYIREQLEKNGFEVLDHRALEIAKEVAEMVQNGNDYKEIVDKAKKLYETGDTDE